MDKIKKFITCLVPVYVCNFQCLYCYLNHHIENALNKGKIIPFADSTDKLMKSLSIERLGGICYFNLCAAGETMMHPQLIDLVSGLTKEGHYVDIVTNGSLSRKFDELLAALDGEQRSRMFIKFSWHYIELNKRNMMDKFLNNVNKVKASGISYTIEITPHDELVPYIEEIKDFSLKNFGALPHITVARNENTRDISLLTKYSRDDYKKIWSVFDSEMFDFKLSIFNVNRCEFCYAGEWSIAINLEDGYYSQCYVGDRLGNIYDINKPLNLRPIGKCREPHCFNGHAFLGLGNIPEIGKKTTYADERDRITETGNHWLQPRVLEFFNSKLEESNEKYDDKEKKKILMCNKLLSCLNKIERAKNKLTERISVKG